MTRAAHHYTRLADQAESMRHHKALLKAALGCLFAAVAIVVLATFIGSLP